MQILLVDCSLTMKVSTICVTHQMQFECWAARQLGKHKICSYYRHICNTVFFLKMLQLNM